jgi:hypothetical protein
MPTGAGHAFTSRIEEVGAIRGLIRRTFGRLKDMQRSKQDLLKVLVAIHQLLSAIAIAATVEVCNSS